MKTVILAVEKRTAMGQKVKALRRSGMTPANIFGREIDSEAIQVNTAEVEKVLAKAGATQLITLKAPTFNADRQVLTQGVRRDPVTCRLLHVDFHQVSMKEMVKVEVPLVFRGDAPASRRKDLILLENIHSIDVECLPNAIPESIEIDLGKLEEAGDHILVSDLKLGDGITALTHPGEIIARVVRLAKAEETVKVAEGAAETAETAEGGAEADATDKGKGKAKES
ncbi:MAG: 50S ribosomal protein L25 [Dehalococcoidia bacterium]